jgi:hypothetical protein
MPGDTSTNGSYKPTKYAIVPLGEHQPVPVDAIEWGSYSVVKDRIDGVTRSKADALVKQAVKAKAALSRVDSLQQSLGHYAELFQEMEQRVFALEDLVRKMDAHKQKLDANETERMVAERIRAAIDSLPDPDDPTPGTPPTTPSALPGNETGEDDALVPGEPSHSGQYPVASKPALSRAPAQSQFRTPAGVSLGTADDDLD